MTRLALVGKHGEGKFAIVDADMLAELRQYRWLLANNGYVYRQGRDDNGKPCAVFMHHHVLGVRGTFKNPVDHKNNNPLDNRRSNLRHTTQAVNVMNNRVRCDNLSGVKYVHLWPKKTGLRYVVSTHRGGRIKRYGTFRTLEEAAAVAATIKEGD